MIIKDRFTILKMKKVAAGGFKYLLHSEKYGSSFEVFTEKELMVRNFKNEMTGFNEKQTKEFSVKLDFVNCEFVGEILNGGK